jgi:hypothetical protein
MAHTRERGTWRDTRHQQVRRLRAELERTPKVTPDGRDNERYYDLMCELTQAVHRISDGRAGGEVAA